MKQYTYYFDPDTRALTRSDEPISVKGDVAAIQILFYIPTSWEGTDMTSLTWRCWYTTAVHTKIETTRMIQFVSHTVDGDYMILTMNMSYAWAENAGNVGLALSGFTVDQDDYVTQKINSLAVYEHISPTVGGGNYTEEDAEADDLKDYLEGIVTDAEAARDDAIEAKDDAESARDAVQGSAAQIDINKNAITGLAIKDSETGAIVSVDDGADSVPMKSLVVQIEPKQDLSNGDPSPNNVCPITGWTGANVHTSGKNLLRYRDDIGLPKVSNDITFSDGGNGTIIANGTASGTAFVNLTSASDPCIFKPGESYILSSGNANVAIHLYVDGVTIGYGQTVNYTFPADFTSAYVRLRVAQGTSLTNSVAYPMVILASEADTTYAPYDGELYSVDWTTPAGTVYKGSVDVVSGLLTVTHKSVDMGTLEWNYSAGNGFYTSNIADATSNDTSVISSAFKFDASANNLYAADMAADLNENEMAWYSNHPRAFIKNTTYTDATAFQSFVSGVQMVYTLATALTYQLTPQQVTSLLGKNNIFADTGDVTVTYPTDTKGYVDGITGDLANLNTTDKDNLVDAINEVDSHADTNANNINTNTSAIGTLGNLTTTAKTDLVSSINEVDANVALLETAVKTAKQALAIKETVSGDIATFADGGDDLPMVKCTANIEPVHDLNGYSKPWPGGGGKNVIPLTLDGLQSDNTAGTWSGNAYTNLGVTYTINTDDGGNITGIATSGTASGTSALVMARNITFASGEYTFSGCPSGGSDSTYRMTLFPLSVHDYGNSASFTSTEQSLSAIVIYIFNGTDASGLTFYPMLCLSSATDPTVFAPYSNLCPITGWTGAEVNITGVNVWDEEWEVGSIDESTGENVIYANEIRSTNYVSIKPSTTYYLHKGSNNNTNVFYYDADKTYLGYATISANSTFTTDSDAAYMRFRFLSAYGTTYNNDLSVNYPSSETSYVAYNSDSTTHTVTWTDAGTVYKGTVDLPSGVLTVTHAAVDLGTLTWSLGSFFSSTGISSVIDPPSSNSTVADIYSDTFAVSSRTDVASANNQISIQPNGYIVIYSTTWSDAATFKSDMSGHYLYYPLATQQTYQLTEEEVLSLLGNNNVWADCGSMADVTFCADTKLYVDAH